jgi:hypothetical protein
MTRAIGRPRQLVDWASERCSLACIVAIGPNTSRPDVQRRVTRTTGASDEWRWGCGTFGPMRNNAGLEAEHF